MGVRGAAMMREVEAGRGELTVADGWPEEGLDEQTGIVGTSAG